MENTLAYEHELHYKLFVITWLDISNVLSHLVLFLNFQNVGSKIGFQYETFTFYWYLIWYQSPLLF